MHACLEGNFKRHLLNFIIKYTTLTSVINNEYRSVLHFPGLLKFKHGIYKTTSTLSDPALLHLVGEEMENILRTVVLVFAG